MIRRCMLCQRLLGRVEPFENTGITDGMCDSCLDVMKRDPEEYNRRARLARARKLAYITKSKMEGENV